MSKRNRSAALKEMDSRFSDRQQFQYSGEICNQVEKTISPIELDSRRSHQYTVADLVFLSFSLS